jgi:copper(I)-binding protein
MSKFNQRRTVLQAGLALCASLVLPSARGCEFFTSTMRITHPWTRATAPDATSAVLCMKFDQVTETDRLIGVETPVATGAELVGQQAGAAVSQAVNFLIPAGRETLLSDEGTHIRLVGLTQPLFVGRSYPLELAFEKSGTVLATLNVDFLGLRPLFVRPLAPPVNR